MDKTTGKKYAVKMILKTGNMDLDRLRKEVDIMKKAGRHPNIVALIDVFEDENCMYLVME
jgi:calcium-dependent protein kinase